MSLFFAEIGLLLTPSELNEVLLKLCVSASSKSTRIHIPVKNRTAKGLWISTQVRSRRDFPNVLLGLSVCHLAAARFERDTNHDYGILDRGLSIPVIISVHCRSASFPPAPLT